MIQIIDPDLKESLSLSDDGKFLENGNGEKKYLAKKGVFSFLETPDNFYEGAYLNKIKFIPRSKNWFHQLPLWLISNGYLWEVKKQFEPNSTLLELGCASGVDYFGSRYQMIGLDLSFTSLAGLHNYKYALQADATRLPLADKSVDGIISSYFWEHIPPAVKDEMLTEFKRVLKPGGKLVFLYDVETKNTFVNLLKKDNPKRYQELFLDKDGHLGYETPEENKQRFIKYGYEMKKHFGMERTWFQSNSVYEKCSKLPGFIGFYSKIWYYLTRRKTGNYLNTFFVRVVDTTIGRIWPVSNSRIIISCVEFKNKTV